jgi:hypothetical protein
MLQQIGWPHRALASAVGHSVSDAQLRAALTFLGHPFLGHQSQAAGD